MKQIKRQHLIEAVEAGIERATFTPAEAEKLRAFARTATQVGDTYSNGCPLSAVELATSGPPLFETTYDRILHKLTRNFPVGNHEVAEVVE